MYQMQEQMTVERKKNVRGGAGAPEFCHLFSAEEVGGRAQMLAVITLQPGESIGEHDHTANGEGYLVLEGEVTVTDGAESRVLCAGDAEFCADGNTHSICNHTDKAAKFFAFILPNR